MKPGLSEVHQAFGQIQHETFSVVIDLHDHGPDERDENLLAAWGPEGQLGSRRGLLEKTDDSEDPARGVLAPPVLQLVSPVKIGCDLRQPLALDAQGPARQRPSRFRVIDPLEGEKEPLPVPPDRGQCQLPDSIRVPPGQAGARLKEAGGVLQGLDGNLAVQAVAAADDADGDKV